MVECECDAVVT